MLTPPPDPLGQHIREFLEAQRKPGPIELAQQRLEERHGRLFKIREP